MIFTGLHIHVGESCVGNQPGLHYYSTATFTDTDIEPWKATSWSSDMGGRAYGTVVVNSGYSIQQNIGHVVVLHNAAGKVFQKATL